MANPQLEDGYLQICNELAEALARTKLTPSQGRLLWALLRKTYGWHKKADFVSISQFQRLTGLKRRHTSRTLAQLIQRNIVNCMAETERKKFYGIQKDYTKWL